MTRFFLSPKITQFSNQAADTFALRTLSTSRLADFNYRISLFSSLQPNYRPVSRRAGAKIRVHRAERTDSRAWRDYMAAWRFGWRSAAGPDTDRRTGGDPARS